eukprot:8490829-Alexandrium_andersonii.AAC.1
MRSTPGERLRDILQSPRLLAVAVRSLPVRRAGVSAERPPQLNRPLEGLPFQPVDTKDRGGCARAD